MTDLTVVTTPFGDLEKCAVCRASHQCGLPPRHDGDHGCLDEDDEGVPHATWPRDADHQYSVNLLRYHDGDFCDLRGPVDVSQYANPLLDHAMKAHPEIWASDYADEFPDYLGDGQWSDDLARKWKPKPGDVTFSVVGPVRRDDRSEPVERSTP